MANDIKKPDELDQTAYPPSSALIKQVEQTQLPPEGATMSATTPEAQAASTQAQYESQRPFASHVAQHLVENRVSPEQFYQAAVAAAQGDTEAQQFIAGHNLGTAMATVSGGAPKAKLPKGFSVMTAENPRGMVRPAAENMRRLELLKQELQEKGIPFKEGKGYYGETPENSIFIPHSKNVNPEAINEIAKQYGQEAVVHRIGGQTNRFDYVSGPKAGQSHLGSDILEHPELTKNYTEIDGKKFSLQFDWDKLHGEAKPSELVHYSQFEKPLREISPEFMGSGRQGAEASRGNIIPRSYYYESSAKPETIVTEAAKHKYTVERPHNIIDLMSPEAMPFREAAQDINDLERMLKEAGYAGYTNSHPDNPVQGAVALFGKQPVKSVKPAYAVGGMVYSASTGDSAENPQTFDDGGEVQPIAQGGPQEQQEIPVINPEGDFGYMPAHQFDQDAMDQGFKQATPEDIHRHSLEKIYGTGAQQLLTGLEGAASAATFGLSTGLETALGVSPESITARREINPLAHATGQVAGLIGTAFLPGVGEAAAARASAQAARAAAEAGTGTVAAAKAAELAAKEALNPISAASLMGAAGKEASKAIGFAGKPGFISQVGDHTVRAAIEGTLFQAGDEVSKAFAQDPNQSAETAIANMGLAGIMSGVFGGSVGAAMVAASKVKPTIAKFVSQLDKEKVDAGDFKATVEHSGMFPENEQGDILAALKKEKANADEIRGAAKRLGDAPVLEGMISDHRLIQKAEDSLINGVPTYSGIKRQGLYNEAWGKANSAVEGALGEESKLTKAELGNELKSSIVKDFEAKAAPIEDLYREIKQYHEAIPLPAESPKAVAAELANIPELRISPSSPEGELASRVMSEIEGLKTVDDVKLYKSILNRSIAPTASSGEKHMASVIGDLLSDLEEKSIIKFAKTQMKTPEAKERIMDLLSKREVANASYKEFITRVKTLSEQLGKGKVYGKQDAINFIRERLTPEEIVQKLGTKKDSEFLKFFAKEFPKEAELMTAYQRSALREASQHEGQLSLKKLFNNINKLEPEVQASIFGKKALQTIKNAETYVNSFPKNFNPSGTSHSEALREFFKSPWGMAIANARDKGIEWFIKHAGAHPEVKNAVELAQATVKADKVASQSIKAIFNPLKASMPAAVISINTAKRAQLDKLVAQSAQDPNKLFAINDNNPSPEYAAGFAAAAGRATQYLASIKPSDKQANPLDKKMPPTAMENAKYNRALDIAQNPLSILNHVKNGTLLPEDLVTLKTIYPNLYKGLSDKMMTELVNAAHKGISVPYQSRASLSMFLGQPLDSTLTPQGIMAIQAMNQKSAAQNQMNQQPQAPVKHKTSALNKLAPSYQTQGQKAEANQRTR